MTYALHRYLALLRAFPDLTPEQRPQYINEPHRHFIRSSPLTRRTVAFILKLVRKSTAVELHDFFGFLGRAPVTKSAFAQRRRAIRPAFFRDFFYRSVADFYTCFRHAAAGDPTCYSPWTAPARPCPARTGLVVPLTSTKTSTTTSPPPVSC